MAFGIGVCFGFKLIRRNDGIKHRPASGVNPAAALIFGTGDKAPSANLQHPEKLQAPSPQT
jgi:hypothetical protein